MAAPLPSVSGALLVPPQNVESGRPRPDYMPKPRDNPAETGSQKSMLLPGGDPFPLVWGMNGSADARLG